MQYACAEELRDPIYQGDVVTVFMRLLLSFILGGH